MLPVMGMPPPEGKGAAADGVRSGTTPAPLRMRVQAEVGEEVAIHVEDAPEGDMERVLARDVAARRVTSDKDGGGIRGDSEIAP